MLARMFEELLNVPYFQEGSDNQKMRTKLLWKKWFRHFLKKYMLIFSVLFFQKSAWVYKNLAVFVLHLEKPIEERKKVPSRVDLSQEDKLLDRSNVQGNLARQFDCSSGKNPPFPGFIKKQ